MSSRIAKLSAPRTTGAVMRERPARCLEQALASGAVWVGAHAGSGKTTLVAAHLAAVRRRAQWYRVDSGDLDAAAFFHHLASTVPRRARQRSLPRFGPEYAGRTAVFARHFFRAFFLSFPVDSVLVLDDLHNASAVLLPQLIGTAIDELPNDQALILVSRDACPADFTARRACGRLAVLDERVLRFDDHESTALLGRLLGGDLVAAERTRLQQAANGWAAGLVLLAGHRALTGTADANLGAGLSRDALFNYFQSEIHNRLDANDRRFVLLTALLVDVTPESAARVTGDPGAAARLDAFCQRNLFITRQSGRQARFRYHDLFREFLLARMVDEIDIETLNGARIRAAASALDSGAIASAFELLLDAEAYEHCGRLLADHGRALVTQGRSATLADAARRLPATAIAAHPRIELWVGSARMSEDARSACRHFEAAYTGLCADDDPAFACLAAAQAVLAIHMSWQNHSGGAAWMERLQSGLASAPALPPSDRLRVGTALLRAAGMSDVYRVNDDLVGEQARALLGMLEDPLASIDVNDRMIAADALQEYALVTGNGEIFARVTTASAPFLADAGLSVWAKCHWLISFGVASGRRFPHRKSGFPYPTASDALREAWVLSRAHGLPSLTFAATNNLINVARAEGRYAEAAQLVDRLAVEYDPARPTQVAEFHQHTAIRLATEENYPAALATSAKALEIAERAGYPLSEMWSLRLTRAQILLGLDDHASAAALCAEQAPLFTGVFRRTWDIFGRTNAAWQARTRGDGDYVHLLAATMAEVRSLGWVNYLSCVPRIVERLWGDALEHGIERAFIVDAIRRRRLCPPDDYTPTWPWPVRIRLLGIFQLERDDAVVQLGAKAPRKPLELLRLVAVAPQQTIDARTAIAALWPDADPLAAKKALEAAIHRLRKLLDCENAVLVTDGKLRLDPAQVWVDAVAFEAWLDKAQQNLDAHASLPTADLLAQRLFRDYRGALFGDDPPAAWAVAPRERLHRKFLQLAGGLGRFREVQGDWVAGRAVYERGLEHDPLAEEFYRGVIRCCLNLNESAAALNTFRRCRELLSVVLGVAPSPATMALMTRLHGASEGHADAR